MVGAPMAFDDAERRKSARKISPMRQCETLRDQFCAPQTFSGLFAKAQCGRAKKTFTHRPQMIGTAR
jgi:hypothetical protein